jgi:glycosyltransferase involved in cell wall biosynthesis
MSTYNAQQYLRVQLNSLLAQTYKDIQIVVRDDGSKDDTVRILAEYARRHENITYYAGSNLGAIASFWNLMKRVELQEWGYLAFCDQDDYWLSTKVERAVTHLKSNDDAGSPLLYCSKTQLVDADLKPLANEINKEITPDYRNALIENVVTGCTTVLNREMYRIALSYIPKYCIMHDWWLYLVATCFGQVIYDEKPSILYRQHGGNVMGIDGTYQTERRNRLKKFQSRKSNICIQAGEFARLLSEHGATEQKREQYETARLLADYKKGCNRFRLLKGRTVFRQRKEDDRIFKLLFLLGAR